MRRILIAASLALLPAAPALAASNYSVACEDGSFPQRVREGTGNRELMQGTGSIPFWCPSTSSIQNHRIGLEGPALDTLRGIAAMPAGDDELVIKHVEWRDDDTPVGEATRAAIGWEKEKTFGQLRKSLAGLATPTGEWVADTSFRSYTAKGCDQPLIPLRYYWVTGAPFPACKGGKLVKGTEETMSLE